MDKAQLEIYEELINKCDKHGYESLSRDERIWYNVGNLIDEAENAGLLSYYYNQGANHLQDTIKDLKLLKATSVIKILQQINNLFPNGIPPENVNERNKIIESWEDEKTEKLLYKLDGEFEKIIGKLENNLQNVIKRIVN